MARVKRPAAEGAPEAGVRQLVGGVAAITVLALAIAGLSLRQSRHQYEQEALLASQNLARLLTQSIDDLIAKVDVVLLHVKDDAESPGAGRSLEALLGRQLAHVPELRSLRIADAGGRIVHGLSEGEAGAREVGDREHFRRLAGGATVGLVISRPLRSRVTGEWILVLGRRIEGSGGAFAGAVLATIPLSYFQELFAAVSIGEHGGISLRDAEMGIVVRHPAPADLAAIVGNKVMSPELRRPFEAGEPAATFFTPASWDNVAKAVSYRKVANHPLYVNVGIATEDYMARWRTELLATLALLALFLGVVGFFALALRHELLERQDRTAEVLRRTRERLALHYQQSMLAVIEWDADERVRFWSPAAERIFGYASGEAVGRRASELIAPRAVEGEADASWSRFLRRAGGPHELSGLDRSGTERVCEWFHSPVPGETGAGEGVISFAADVTARKRAEREREDAFAHLQKALAEIKTLHGILPICSGCKKIRDEEGAWQQLESYITERSDILFSHGLCKECVDRLYPELAE